MADDVVVLLDFIGWTDPRQLHVVGISMGGMISQGRPTRPLSLRSRLAIELGFKYRARMEDPGTYCVPDPHGYYPGTLPAAVC